MTRRAGKRPAPATSRRTWRRATHWLPWLLAAVAGTAIGVPAGALPGHHPEVPRLTMYERDQQEVARAGQVPPGDRMRAAIQGVSERGLYIGPELRHLFTSEDIARAEQIIAAADVPLFVVWWAPTTEAGYYLIYDALAQLRAGVGREGLYAVVEPGGHTEDGAIGYEKPYVFADTAGRPGPSLLRYVETMAAVEPERPEPPSTDSDDYWGGPGGGFAAGLLFVGLGYPLLLLVVGLTGLAARARKAA